MLIIVLYFKHKILLKQRIMSVKTTKYVLTQGTCDEIKIMPTDRQRRVFVITLWGIVACFHFKA